MKRYGIWNVVLQTAYSEVVNIYVTANSGKDARKRIEKQYEGCEIFKMVRLSWLTGFSRSQLSAVLFSFDQKYGHALADILEDNGVFSGQDTPPSDVDEW